MVTEPSVFEPLKFYSRYFDIVDIYIVAARGFPSCRSSLVYHITFLGHMVHRRRKVKNIGGGGGVKV